MLLQNQRTLGYSYNLKALLETHRGFLSVQEHREVTLIYDVEVVIRNAMTKSKNTDQIWCPEGSFGDTLRLYFCPRTPRGDIDL